MLQRSPDIRRLVEVARLYYESGLTQQEIGARLNTSRPAVQRMIQAAREQGIIRILVQDPLESVQRLGEQLETAFGLLHAIVLPSLSEDLEATKARVGEAAACYLESMLDKNQTLAVAWGTTVGEVAKALKPRRMENLQVVQMVGELGLGSQASETFRAIAERLGARAIGLPAPAIEGNPAIRRSIRKSTHVQNVFRILRRADIALTGIGPVSDEATIVRRGHVTTSMMHRLRQHGAVGEISTNFFGRQGRPLQGFNEKVISLKLDEIRKIGCVIGVVSEGPGKAEAVLGALRGRYLNVLVVDEALATKVLEAQAAHDSGDSASPSAEVQEAP